MKGNAANGLEFRALLQLNNARVSKLHLRGARASKIEAARFCVVGSSGWRGDRKIYQQFAQVWLGGTKVAWPEQFCFLKFNLTTSLS